MSARIGSMTASLATLLVAVVVVLLLILARPAWAQQDVPAGAITARSDVHLDLQSLPGTRQEALQQLGAAVRTRMVQIRTCYDNAVRARPDLAGDLRLLLETGPRGTVTTASVAEDHLGSPGVARCVIRVLRALGRPLPPTARGHIVLRFTNTMARGLASPPAPAPAATPSPPS